jgi:hypothetical protein
MHGYQPKRMCAFCAPFLIRHSFSDLNSKIAENVCVFISLSPVLSRAASFAKRWCCYVTAALE